MFWLAKKDYLLIKTFSSDNSPHFYSTPNWTQGPSQRGWRGSPHNYHGFTPRGGSGGRGFTPRGGSGGREFTPRGKHRLINFFI